MNKKLVVFLVMCVLTLSLTGCKASDSYQGKWFATMGNGEECEIEFSEKTMTITKDGQVVEEQNFKQNQTGFKNNVSYYGIQAENGQSYSIVFPNKKEKKNAVFVEPTSSDEPTDGSILYALDRNDYPDYSQYLN